MKNLIMMTTAAVLLNSSNDVFAVTPQEILSEDQNSKTFADGVIARKGTFSATLANAKIFEEMGADAQALEVARSDQLELIPALDHIGFFQFFEPAELLSSIPRKEGRAWIAVLYYSIYPQRITPEARDKLYEVSRTASSLLRQEIQMLLLF